MKISSIRPLIELCSIRFFFALCGLIILGSCSEPADIQGSESSEVPQNPVVRSEEDATEAGKGEADTRERLSTESMEAYLLPPDIPHYDVKHLNANSEEVYSVWIRSNSMPDELYQEILDHSSNREWTFVGGDERKKYFSVDRAFAELADSIAPPSSLSVQTYQDEEGNLIVYQFIEMGGTIVTCTFINKDLFARWMQAIEESATDGTSESEVIEKVEYHLYPFD